MVLGQNPGASVIETEYVLGAAVSIPVGTWAPKGPLPWEAG